MFLVALTFFEVPGVLLMQLRLTLSIIAITTAIIGIYLTKKKIRNHN